MKYRGRPRRPACASHFALAAALLANAGCVSLRPWSEATRELGDDQFVQLDGREIHVEQRGHGEPLVLLHGFGGSTFAYRKAVPTLAERFRVVAIDLNGFGYTQRSEEPAAYTLEGQGKLVLGVLDRLGLERVRLAGHSYGGGVALYLAAERPERIDRLLLIDNALPRYASERRGSFVRWRWLADVLVRTVGLRTGRIEQGLRESYFDDRLVTADVVGEYTRRLRIEGATDAYRGLLGPSSEPPYELDFGRIRQPTLVVWGEKDELIPVAGARARSAKLPKGRFVALPACGHTPMEECPRAFLEAVMPFLTEPEP